MSIYDYKIIPAPTRARRIKGSRNSGERYAATLEALMREAAQEGWEYLRREEHEFEAREGLFKKLRSRREAFLVFRRSAKSGAVFSLQSQGNEAGYSEPPLKATQDPTNEGGVVAFRNGRNAAQEEARRSESHAELEQL